MWQSSHVTANNFNAVLTSFCNGINIIFRSFFCRDFHLLLKLSVIKTQSQRPKDGMHCTKDNEGKGGQSEEGGEGGTLLGQAGQCPAERAQVALARRVSETFKPIVTA